MKCLYTVCKKENKCIVLRPEDAIVPAECDIGELRKLFSYFQYKAPNIDSVHSPLLPFEYHFDVLEEIVKNNVNYIFVAQNSDTEVALRKVSLFGEQLCDKCKRFMCKRMTNSAKRDRTRKESDLECLLRHLRNAIAHDHVFVHHAGNHISVCFEDMSEKGKPTARILCTQADLKKWKRVLEEAVANIKIS